MKQSETDLMATDFLLSVLTGASQMHTAAMTSHVTMLHASMLAIVKTLETCETAEDIAKYIKTLKEATESNSSKEKREMRHDWNYSQYGAKMEDIEIYGRRICTNCGAEQTKEAQTSWMRVIGYKWEPLVGLCKISKARNK